MKKSLFFAFFIIVYALNAFGQLEVNLLSDHGNDTVRSCTDTVIEFYALAKLNGIPLDSGYYYWYFDDGDYEEGINLDTIEHTFLKRKGHRVFVSVRRDSLYAFDILNVELGLRPDFEETHTSLKEDEGLCSGDKVVLTGVAKSKTWIEKRNFSRLETFPVFIDTSHDYLSSLMFLNFPKSAEIGDSNFIDSIGLFMEHSDFQDVKISLVCPSGKSVVLKDTGGMAQYFGEPVLSGYEEGEGYWYFWSETATQTMNEFSGNDTLPSGVYKPDSSFDALKGCPVDGKWLIKVEQTGSTNDNGYGFGWKMFFNQDSLQPDTLLYYNTYDLNYSAWVGDNVNLTSNGVADAYPEEEGQHKYYFYIKDDFGCFHDTSLVVEVERANFTVDKFTVYIGDSILVEDKTSWAKEWEWDFGDDSPIETEKKLYHKYFEKDTFLITMTVYSESGCSDFDTAKIIVQPKPIEIQEYNIFTPNGDGVNDVFSFFNTPDEKIVAANIESIKGRIYNRYGEVVCEWNTPEEAIKGWDGTINNNGIFKAPPGFYYYVLIIKGKDGKKYEPFTGVIYLYRER